MKAVVFSLLVPFARCSALQGVRAVSLDVTGTLLTHGEPVMRSYAAAAVWARLPNPPTEAELKPAFKRAYKELLEEHPCFGGCDGLPGREWWRRTILRVMTHCERSYADADFERFFRRVYQHFGSPQAYARLSDADEFLAWAAAHRPDLVLGITSNTPTRHMESVLPMMGLHDYFSWFTCSQDVGAEKPAVQIFDAAFQEARFWLPELERHEVPLTPIPTLSPAARTPALERHECHSAW